MDQAAFDELVVDALDSLPDEIKQWLDNVAIVVADQPSRAQMAQAGVGRRALLFGLYVGVPKTRRGFTYGETGPDKTVIFKSAIEKVCVTSEQVRSKVRQAVLHEIGHHFGLNEEDLRSSGF